MFLILISFIVTVISTSLLIWLSRNLSIGQDINQGVQKFHVKQTSRLGGVAIFFGLVFAASSVPELPLSKTDFQAVPENQALSNEINYYLFCFLMASLPVWIAGLIEDLTHKVGPTMRLVMAAVSATLLYVMLGIGVSRTDVWPIDLLLNLPGITFIVTILVVSGFTHSINIVDGFHGLASGLVMISICGLAYLAWKVGDRLVLQICQTYFAVVLGFFIFNWPKGGIFLGDAGAYLLGFWLVELGILLAMRNLQISPMTPVVVGLVPLIETLFSIYRRNIVRKSPINQPDALHLHTLIYRRLSINLHMFKGLKQKNIANSKVALFFWVPAVIFSSISCFFMSNTKIQLVLILIYTIMYIWLYKKLVKFKSPKLLIFR